MASMEELIAQSQRYLMNTYARFPVVIVKGEGVRVWDVEGKEYLDFVAGIAVNNLGHCHPKVVAAIREQAEQLLHISNLYHIEPQIRLARLLCQHSFARKAFFCNSGAEANEAAIKLARKYARERWSSDRYEIITTYNSFHGRTLGALSATGQEKYQHGFGPLVPGFKYVPYNDLRAMERAVDAHTAAILVEPIQGEGGVHVPGDDYLPGIRRLCDETGALFILDEIQTGMGRTGKLFAYQHWGASPDIMTLAKGLGGGLPIGAVLAREEVAEHFTPGSHGSTFGGTPIVTAVAYAAVSALMEEHLPERAAKVGAYLMERLEALKGRYPLVKEIRGKGLLIAMEVEADARALVRRCLEKGLLLNAVSDTALRFMPPLVVAEADVDQALAILDDVFKEVP